MSLQKCLASLLFSQIWDLCCEWSRPCVRWIRPRSVGHEICFPGECCPGSCRKTKCETLGCKKGGWKLERKTWESSNRSNWLNVLMWATFLSGAFFASIAVYLDWIPFSTWHGLLRFKRQCQRLGCAANHGLLGESHCFTGWETFSEIFWLPLKIWMPGKLAVSLFWNTSRCTGGTVCQGDCGNSCF